MFTVIRPMTITHCLINRTCNNDIAHKGYKQCNNLPQNFAAFHLNWTANFFGKICHCI